jgi:hypothetical protein
MPQPQAKFVISADDNTRSAFRRVRSGLSDVSASATRTAATVAKVGGASTAAAGGIAYLVDRTLDQAQQLDNLSRQTGFSVERIQELRFAARATGIEAQEMDSAVAELSQRMGEAAQDGGEMAEGFEQAGLEVDKLTSRNPAAVFNDVADAIRRADTEAEASAIAVKVFGEEEGRRILPLLRQSADRMEELTDRAREMGYVMSSETVSGARDAADQLDTLKGVLTAQFTKAVAQLGPDIAEFTGSLAENPEVIKDFVSRVGDLASNLGEVASTAEHATRNIEAFFQGMGVLDETELSRQDKLRQDLSELRVEAVDARRSVRALQDAVENGRDAEIKAIAESRLGPAQKRLERIREKMAGIREELTALNAPGFEAPAGGGTTEGGEAAGGVAGTSGGGTTKQPAEEEVQAANRLGIKLTEIKQQYAAMHQQAEREAKAQADLMASLSDGFNEQASRQDRLNQLLERGDITFDRYADAMLGAKEASSQLADEQKRTQDEVARTGDTVQRTASTIASNFTNATSNILSIQRSQYESLDRLADEAEERDAENADRLRKRADKAEQAAKRAFKANKRAQEAQVVVNTASAIMRAYAELGPIAGSVAAGVIGAAGTTQLALIEQTKFRGQAHDGMQNVPETGTYYLEKGERVVKQEDNRRLERMLDRQEKGQGSGGQAPINLTMNVSAVDGPSVARMLESQQGRIVGLVQKAYDERARRGGPLK